MTSMAAIERYFCAIENTKISFCETIESAKEVFLKRPVNIVICAFSFSGFSAQQFIRSIGGLSLYSYTFFVLLVDNINDNIKVLAGELNINQLIQNPFSLNEVKGLMRQALVKLQDEPERWERDLMQTLATEKDSRDVGSDLQFKELLIHYDDNTTVLFESARYYYNQKNLDLAQKLLEKVFEKKGEHLKSLDLMGHICKKEGKVTLAMEYWTRAQAQSPLNTTRNLCLAHAEIEQASTRMTEILKLEKSNAQAALSRIKLNICQGNYSCAKEQMKEQMREQAKERTTDKNNSSPELPKEEWEAWKTLLKKMLGAQKAGS